MALTLREVETLFFSEHVMHKRETTKKVSHVKEEEAKVLDAIETKKDSDATDVWCTVHRVSTHSTSDCRALPRNGGKGGNAGGRFNDRGGGGSHGRNNHYRNNPNPGQGQNRNDRYQNQNDRYQNRDFINQNDRNNQGRNDRNSGQDARSQLDARNSNQRMDAILRLNDYYDDDIRPSSRRRFDAITSTVICSDKNATWMLIDNGSQSHVSCDRELFSSIGGVPGTAEFLNGSTAELREGILSLGIKTQNGIKNLVLKKETFFSESIKRNVLSFYQLQILGFDVIIYTHDTLILSRGDFVIEATKMDGRFYVEVFPLKSRQIDDLTQSKPESQLELWHRRLNHAGFATLREICASEISPNESGQVGVCEACQLGQQKRMSHKRGPPHLPAALPLYTLHGDLAGPIKPRTWDGKRYIDVVICENTTHVWPNLLRKKNQSETAFQVTILHLNNSLPLFKCAFYNTDGGGEYGSNAFEKFLTSQGIKHRLTNPHSPEENSMAEKIIGYIFY